jgi:hypothetical protein
MRKTILIATIAALSVAAVSLLPTMPILAEKQTPVERRDALLSADGPGADVEGQGSTGSADRGPDLTANKAALDDDPGSR